MGMGIILCGLNGSGKSTLGKALAAKLGFHFIDIENLYFPKTSDNYEYAIGRTRNEVCELLINEIKLHENFVLAAVKGDYGAETTNYYSLAVMIEAPKNVRLQRVRDRARQKFGDRVLSGGDLHEQEERFLRMVSSRDDQFVEGWIQSLRCPIIRIDGTMPIEESISIIAGHIKCPSSLLQNG